MNIKAVGTDAGLPGIAVFGGHGSGNSSVNVGIFKHNEGGVTTQLKAELFNRWGALCHQNTADFSRAGKGEVAHNRRAAQCLANEDGMVCVPRHHINYARGYAGLATEFGQSQG